VTRLTVAPAPSQAAREILSEAAVEFLAELDDRFGARREELLDARRRRAAALRAGATLDFLEETREVRGGEWQVPPPRPDYADRRVEITGPTEAKLIINALGSGAQGFMADFEDANSPSWRNQIEGQSNLYEAVRGTLTHEGSDGRHYELAERRATLLVRPRGWHLPEKHIRSERGAISGALVDFGLYVFHCAAELLERGSAPYLYLPKLEHHLEARLWNDVLAFAERRLDLPHGSIRPTVLIETLPAAFQMEEILFELRERSYGLNAGRWDYIFSTIKTLGERPEFLLPDREQVRMTVPFMHAYTELLVSTCHRRGAFAMGGMAALIPSRRDPEANERAIEAVRADKEREAAAGFDGTWVAHPDVVEVARAAFDEVLGEAPNQIERRRDDVRVTAAELLNVEATPGAVTERGLRANLSVAFQYISFWLSGRGAAGINNLMEDAATAEIARSQVWQWVRQRARLEDGRPVTRELVLALLEQETSRIHAEVGEEVFSRGHPAESREILERTALAEELPAFLPLLAYEHLD
jgi:malate synthase